jgi:hypothetical protein
MNGSIATPVGPSLLDALPHLLEPALVIAFEQVIARPLFQSHQRLNISPDAAPRLLALPETSGSDEERGERTY